MSAFPLQLDPNNPLLKLLGPQLVPQFPTGGLQRLPVPDTSGMQLMPKVQAQGALMGGTPPTADVSGATLARLPIPDAAPAPDNGVPKLTQLATDQNRLNYLRNSGSGISQIGNTVDPTTGVQTPGHSGFWGTLGKIGATVGDDALRLVAPKLEQIIPGTYGHNLALQGTAQNAITNDQNQLQSAATLADTQAQGQQRQALALQEQAKADALTNPKPSNGQLLYDKNGSPIGFQDGDGNFLGMHDPALPHGVGDILASAQRKAPTSAFELWQEQNPKGTAEDYLKMSGEGKVKPLDQQLLEAEASGDTGAQARILNVIRLTKVQPHIDIHNATAPPTGIPTPPSGGGNSPMVQAIIDGRAPAPNSRSRLGMALMAQVMAADPTYDQSRYNTYQAMQKDATTGKTGQNINSLNTLINHINDARQHIPDNGSIPLLNSLENSASSLVGNAPTAKFDADATGIAGEFGKLVSGGVASVDEQKHLQSLLRNNGSKAQISASLDEIENLARGKLAGIQAQIASAGHPGPGSHVPASLPSMGSPAPTTHQFSLSAWQRANPGGDVNAARAAATQQGYQVTP